MAVERIEVAARPFPADGHPIIDVAAPGLYVVATHSGMTLAPAVAELAAAELAAWDVGAGRPAGVPREVGLLLEPYRLGRDFEEGAKRAAYGWK